MPVGYSALAIARTLIDYLLILWLLTDILAQMTHASRYTEASISPSHIAIDSSLNIIIPDILKEPMPVWGQKFKNPFERLFIRQS